MTWNMRLSELFHETFVTVRHTALSNKLILERQRGKRPSVATWKKHFTDAYTRIMLITIWCPTTGVNKPRATEFRTVAPNICGSSVWNLLHVTLLAPRNLCFLNFCKAYGPLPYSYWNSYKYLYYLKIQFLPHSKHCISNKSIDRLILLRDKKIIPNT